MAREIYNSPLLAESRLTELGVRIVRWPGWVRKCLKWTYRGSTAMGFFGRVFIRDSAWIDGELNSEDRDLVALLNHELVHIERQGRSWRAWWWLVKYLCSPGFRLYEEKLGEAAEAATQWWLANPQAGNPRPPSKDVLEEYYVKHRLGGWQLPYLTPGDPDMISAEIALLARKVVSDHIDRFFRYR